MYQIIYTIGNTTYKIETPYRNTTVKAIKAKYGDRLTAIKSIKLY